MATVVKSRMSVWIRAFQFGGVGGTWEGTRERLRFMGIGKQDRLFEVEIHSEIVLSIPKRFT